MVIIRSEDEEKDSIIHIGRLEKNGDNSYEDEEKDAIIHRKIGKKW
jgi:hypothetical protein